MYRCSGCGFQFGDSSESVRPAVADYDKEYFDPFLTRDSKQHWRKFYTETLTRIAAIAPGRNVLDAGSGTSMFAPVASELGWNAWVLDGSAYAVDLLCNNYGLKGAVADLNSKDAICNSFGKDCMFDAVNSFHVIEHLHAPREYLIGCHNALVPQGVMRIGLPFYPRGRIRNHQLAFQFGLANHPYNFGVPDHVSYFDTQTICRLLREVGFELLDVRKTAFKSIHEIIQAAGRGNWVRNTVVQVALVCGPLLQRFGSYQHLDILARKHA